jgi:phospholipid/cholesterol/gamma-HCH transport system substrate-binding protein
MVVVPPLGPGNIGHYVFAQDTPKFGDDLGPHCYPIPFPGITLNDGAAPSNAAATAIPGTTPGHSGRHRAAQRAHTTAAQLAGSPTESELVRELTGMALGRPAALVPSWGSLLTAPLFRGTTVNLRAAA